jgi:hypothetical protein
MSWNELSLAQQKAARNIQQKLYQAGVETSVSQVAKHLTDAFEWNDKFINLATLCDRTGWSMPDPTVEREGIHSMRLPTGLLRHVRAVLAEEGSAASLEALELLPEATVR